MNERGLDQQKEAQNFECEAFVNKLQERCQKTETNDLVTQYEGLDKNPFARAKFLKDHPDLSKALRDRRFLKEQISILTRQPRESTGYDVFEGKSNGGVLKTQLREEKKRTYEEAHDLYHGLTLPERKRLVEIKLSEELKAFNEFQLTGLMQRLRELREKEEEPENLDNWLKGEIEKYKQEHPELAIALKDLEEFEGKEEAYRQDNYGQEK